MTKTLDRREYYTSITQIMTNKERVRYRYVITDLFGGYALSHSQNGLIRFPSVLFPDEGVLQANLLKDRAEMYVNFP
jgi:hypothetical protein